MSLLASTPNRSSLGAGTHNADVNAYPYSKGKRSKKTFTERYLKENEMTGNQAG